MTQAICRQCIAVCAVLRGILPIFHRISEGLKNRKDFCKSQQRKINISLITEKEPTREEQEQHHVFLYSKTFAGALNCVFYIKKSNMFLSCTYQVLPGWSKLRVIIFTSAECGKLSAMGIIYLLSLPHPQPSKMFPWLSEEKDFLLQKPDKRTVGCS